jgi:hypothetical protein
MLSFAGHSSPKHFWRARGDGHGLADSEATISLKAIVVHVQRAGH